MQNLSPTKDSDLKLDAELYESFKEILTDMSTNDEFLEDRETLIKILDDIEAKKPQT
jgi:hypothetical protein